MDIDDILHKTLDDQRLSRGERKAVKALLADVDATTRNLFRHRAFELARAELGAEASPVLEWLEDVIAATRLGEEPTGAAPEAHFSPGEAPLRRITALIRNAQKSIDVCVFTLTDDRIAEALYAAHKRGVTVRVVSDDDKSWDKGSDVQDLDRGGLSVRKDDSPSHMHHKFAIFDGRVLLTGSYNWTRSAEEKNQENVVVLEDQGLVNRFQGEFDRLWAKFA